MGSPPVPHRGVESNVAAFVLRPTIATVSLLNLQGTGLSLRSADVTLTVDPAIGDLQRVVLLLNERVVASSPPSASPPQEIKSESYSFIAPTRIALSPPAGPPGASHTITIPIKGVKAGTYVVRLQVDGAESVLGTDLNGQFNSPQTTIA
jgi:hypothetical protein